MSELLDQLRAAQATAGAVAAPAAAQATAPAAAPAQAPPPAQGPSSTPVLTQEQLDKIATLPTEKQQSLAALLQNPPPGMTDLGRVIDMVVEAHQQTIQPEKPKKGRPVATNAIKILVACAGGGLTAEQARAYLELLQDNA